MRDLKLQFIAMSKRWWQASLIASGVGLLLLYAGWTAWQSFQRDEITLRTLPTLLAVGILISVLCLIGKAARSYWKEIFVAIVGMVVGAIAGAIPYVVIGLFLILLEFSPENQASSSAFEQLFSGGVFSQLFFVAGAASGGPIAIYVYIERRKEKKAEKKKGVTI